MFTVMPYLLWGDVQPQVGLFILLHVAQVVHRVVNDHKVRHDGDNLGETQSRQLDVEQELQRRQTGNSKTDRQISVGITIWKKHVLQLILVVEIFVQIKGYVT